MVEVKEPVLHLPRIERDSLCIVTGNLPFLYTVVDVPYHALDLLHNFVSQRVSLSMTAAMSPRFRVLALG